MGIYHSELIRTLESLERAIDPAVEDALLSEWLDYIYCRKTEVFTPSRLRNAAIDPPARHILINDAMNDMELMLLRELEPCIHQLRSGAGGMMNIRANYGTSIVMSLFGVEMFNMDDMLDCLPTSWAFANPCESVNRFLERGITDVNSGLVAKALDTGEYFKQMLRPYPKVSKYIAVYHPDLQGPFDIAEVLYGSSIFYALYDSPCLISSFLELICDVYIRIMRLWNNISPYNGEYSRHWGMLHRGCVMLRDDSAMNISPAHFREFVMPYDIKILGEFGGGAVHFCGRGDHYIADMTSQYPMLYAINMSQPHLNDMEKIYRCTIDSGILLLGFDRNYAAAVTSDGRNSRGLIYS